MKKLIFAALGALGCFTTTAMHAQFEGNKPCGYWASIEYLYWKAEQTGMVYAIEVAPLNSALTLGKLSQEFDWLSGFRLSAGYENFCTGVDFDFQWTRYHHATRTQGEGTAVVATELLPLEFFPVTGGSIIPGSSLFSTWNFDFDLFDIDAGYPLHFNCLLLRPYIGVQGARIFQSQIADYNNFQGGINATVTTKGNFYGAGLKAGINSHYPLFCNLSLAGNFSGSLLYGKLDSPTSFFLNDDGDIIDFTFASSDTHFVPHSQLFLGVQWDTCISCTHLTLGLGYEMHHFWNTWRHQNSAIQDLYITDAGYGNLLMQGLTAQLALGF